MRPSEINPKVAVANSPLFKLSADVRLSIYRLIVKVDGVVGFGPSGTPAYDDHFEFCISYDIECEPDQESSCQRCGMATSFHTSQIPPSRGNTPTTVSEDPDQPETFDTALLLTSRAVYAEVISLILGENMIELGMPAFQNGGRSVNDYIPVASPSCGLDAVFTKFENWMPMIRKLVLHDFIKDGPLSVREHSRLRNMAEKFAGLQSLVFHGTIISSGPGRFRIDKRSLMNYFRPLALLPVTDAKVTFSIPNIIIRKHHHLTKGLSYLASHPEAIDKLQKQAQAILLRDPKKPEPAQAEWPERFINGMQHQRASWIRARIEAKEKNETPALLLEVDRIRARAEFANQPQPGMVLATVR